MQKLAIVTTHPIQYNAPWFKLLSERKNIIVKVFYTWGQLDNLKKYDPGFGKNIEWDIPLLDGYDYTFVNNIAKNPGSNHFNGINNPTLNREIESWDANAILVFGWCFKSHLKVLQHFKGKKTILFRGDSTLMDEFINFSFKKIIRKLVLSWVYKHVDTALYVGSQNKAYYLKYGLKHKQLSFAPHAIDNNRFMKESSSNTRDKLGILADAFVFLFVGKFETKKNPELLISAFTNLSDTTSHLILVGNGILEEQLKQNVSALKVDLKNRIHFLPFQNQLEMPIIYKLGNVLVLPSQGPGETWGLAVNEAMACKRAVLVSDKCGCAVDMVKNGINGYTFINKDESDLIKKMILLLDKKETTAEMGNQSLMKIKDWNYKEICLAIENQLV